MKKDIIFELVKETNTKLYGPKWCIPCNTMQPVIVYKLAGSDFTKMDDYILTVGFTGSYVCSVCYEVIKF